MDNRLVLFVSKSCNICSRLLKIIEADVDKEVRFIIQWVSPARNGMYLLRSIDTDPNDPPILVNKEQIPAVPALFDPVTRELVYAIDKIAQYFEDAGLMSHDDLDDLDAGLY